MKYIKEMGDHYAVIALGGQVLGTITRSPGPGNEGMWAVNMINGSNPVSYVPLHFAMQEALKPQG